MDCQKININFDGFPFIDYAEHFTNVGVNIGVGIEHCFDPTKPYSSTVKATTITFSTGNSAYVGYDYYWQMF
mgnify:CR=1 FL=1